jgi:RHS repeat-associated protein
LATDARYAYGPTIDEPLILERDGQSYYYLTDGLGSVVKLVDSAGNVVNSYTYDSFGNIVNKTEGIPNPYTYTAREYDAESGIYFYRTRYYDPQAGRFITEDPSHYPQCKNTNIPYLLPHLLKTPLELNPFLYVGNNPINFTDPLGLLSKCKGDCFYDLFRATHITAVFGFACTVGCAYAGPFIMQCYTACFGLTGAYTTLYQVLYKTWTCVERCDGDDKGCKQGGD